MNEQQNVIEMQDIAFKAGYAYLLKGINWQVKKNEHWVVFGMNGSGKTTLLSLIAGFRQPTMGNLRVLGEAYNAENILALRKRIGWISGSFFEQKYTKESAMDIVLSGKFGTLGLGRPIEDKDIKRARNLLKELRLSKKNQSAVPYDE